MNSEPKPVVSHRGWDEADQQTECNLSSQAAQPHSPIRGRFRETFHKFRFMAAAQNDFKFKKLGIYHLPLSLSEQ